MAADRVEVHVLLSSHEASLRARIGAHSLHAKYDSRKITAPARAAAAASLDGRLLAEIDPHQSLSRPERESRLAHARKAHFQRLALKSARTRGRKAGRRDA